MTKKTPDANANGQQRQQPGPDGGLFSRAYLERRGKADIRDVLDTVTITHAAMREHPGVAARWRDDVSRALREEVCCIPSMRRAASTELSTANSITIAVA
jgi:hypothetical protein